MTDTLVDAWAELDVAVPPNWLVGPATYDERRDEWRLYAWERFPRRHRTGITEWQAIAPTQERVVREMARCLGEIREGRVAR